VDPVQQNRPQPRQTTGLEGVQHRCGHAGVLGHRNRRCGKGVQRNRREQGRQDTL